MLKSKYISEKLEGNIYRNLSNILIVLRKNQHHVHAKPTTH